MRSTLRDPASIPADAEIVLGDSMGEMSFYCALADMTAMGGSFENFGSQNVIEPAMAGSPVVVGPSIFTFDKIIRDGLAHGDVPEEGRQIGEEAKRFAKEYAGATGRMMTILDKLWKNARKLESQMS